MVNKIWLDVKEIKSIFTTIEEFHGSIYQEIFVPRVQIQFNKSNRKGCGANSVQLVSTRKLRIIHSVRSDENSANLHIYKGGQLRIIQLHIGQIKQGMVAEPRGARVEFFP